jgi:predicted aspartyl protease
VAGWGALDARVGALAAVGLLACATPHVRKPIEEEPFVLSPGPPLWARDTLLPEAGHATYGRTPIERVGPMGRVPLVRAEVAGRPTKLLLDTGAYDHVLEGWFARELADAEASGKSAAVIDHANRRVAMDVWSKVSLAIEGWGPLGAIKPLATRDQSPGPMAYGIGGILSPQKLAGDGAVVIDFPAGEMSAEDSSDAMARIAAHRASLGTAIRCGSAYVLAATIEGKDARLLVDTGAFATDVLATSVPGRALSGRSALSRDIYAVGGAVSTRVIADANVVLGELHLKTDVKVVDSAPSRSRCASDGVVGMDVLGACVVVITRNEMRVGCD